MADTWVYVRSEPGLWTVGFYDPQGKWQPDSDHGSTQAAADRAAYLNGSAPAPSTPPPAGAQQAVAKWIDDPHDIEQGQMLNPAWLARHGLTAADALAAPAAAQGAVALPAEASDAMCEAAMEAHYGARRVRACGGARGIDMTVDSNGYNGLQAFRRMWRGAIRALAATPAPEAAQEKPAPMTREWCANYPGTAAGIINELARQIDAMQAPEAAPSAKEGEADTARLNWIVRQGDEFSCSVIVDAPGDGEYRVYGMDNAYGQGKTAREAIDAAIKGLTPAGGDR